MFNLDQAITEWRRQMSAAGLKTVEFLNELESHLRDDVAEQVRTGLNSEEAFAAAVQRIGPARVVQAEFAKSRTRTIRQKLMLLVGLGFAGFIIFLSAFTFYEMEMNAVAQLLAFAAIAVILLSGWGWRYVVPFLPVIQRRRSRLIIGSCVGLSGMTVTAFLVNVIVPQFEASGERVAFITCLWSLIPAMVLGCLGLGLMLSAAEREIYGMRKPRCQRSLATGS
jgi:cation transport ATPase